MSTNWHFFLNCEDGKSTCSERGSCIQSDKHRKLWYHTQIQTPSSIASYHTVNVPLCYQVQFQTSFMSFLYHYFTLFFSETDSLLGHAYIKSLSEYKDVKKKKKILKYLFEKWSLHICSLVQWKYSSDRMCIWWKTISFICKILRHNHSSLLQSFLSD